MYVLTPSCSIEIYNKIRNQPKYKYSKAIRSFFVFIVENNTCVVLEELWNIISFLLSLSYVIKLLI